MFLKQTDSNLKEKKDNLPLINERIRALQVQVIDHNGANIGVVSRSEALEMAEEAHLDLVLLSEEGSEGVPVVKIMDFGKASYEKKKKKSEARKHQKVIKVKEIKVQPKIGEHDFRRKIVQLMGFLQEGMRVKVTLSFRGRENASRENLGGDLFKKIEQGLHDEGLAKNLMQEGDAKIGKSWSRVYFLKTTK